MFQNFKIKIVLIRSILFEFTDLLKYLIIFFLIGIRRTRLEVHQNSDNFLHYITNVVKKKKPQSIFQISFLQVSNMNQRFQKQEKPSKCPL